MQIFRDLAKVVLVSTMGYFVKTQKKWSVLPCIVAVIIGTEAGTHLKKTVIVTGAYVGMVFIIILMALHYPNGTG